MKNLAQIAPLIIATLFTPDTILAAKPPSEGSIAFIGQTANDQASVWLSTTNEGSFEIESRNQTVDTWVQSQSGLHVTVSPIIPNPHSLFEIIDGQMVFIDKDNQQGNISLPPFPGGLPPGEPTYPIALPPGNVTHPIVPPTSQNSYSTSGNIAEKRSNSGKKAPLTAGRQFSEEPFMNIWIDGRYFDIKDYRFGLDREGNAINQTIGSDVRINNDLIVGGMLAYNVGQSSSFNNTWKINAKGVTVGPYFGYRFLPNWSIEGTLGYGRLENHNNLAILKGKYNSNIYCTSLLFRGVYPLDKIQLQFKPALYYNYFNNNRYNMNTMVNGLLFSLPIASNNFAFGLSQLAVEASRPLIFVNNMTTSPYVELGVNYAFVRPNNGKILTRNLKMQRTSPWSGLVRLGIKTLITESLYVEGGGSYLSLGQPNLYVWQAKLLLSWAIK